MRKIIFRGKREDCSWLYGDLIHMERENDFVIMVADWRTKNNEVIPETVGQFTGLTDKNGKEIYEGDIVKYTHDPKACEVLYRANDYGASFLTDSHDGYHSLGDLMNTVEIIGNIHDNPELLTK